MRPGHAFSTRPAVLAILAVLASRAAIASDGWTPQSPRDEIRPAYREATTGGPGDAPALVIETDDRPGLQGFWSKTFPVQGGRHYRFRASRKFDGPGDPRRSAYVRWIWRDADGRPANQDGPLVGPYHAPGQPSRSAPEFPPDIETGPNGWTRVEGVYRAPADATHAVLELHLDWAPQSAVFWSQMSLEAVEPPAPRRVKLATVHHRPTRAATVAECNQQFAPLIAEAARQGADLVVLPEVIPATGTGKPFAEVAEPIPGPSTDDFGKMARAHGVYLVVGLVERDGAVVYNTAALIGPDGTVEGTYRKVCLPHEEVAAGIAPGAEFPVFETRFGRLGIMICYDGFFPEVARELANRGAEVIAFPVAGCNPKLVAARACENQVYIVSSTYTDVSQNWMISAVFDPEGNVRAQAKQWGTVAVAEVDLASPTVWAQIGNFRDELPRHRP